MVSFFIWILGIDIVFTSINSPVVQIQVKNTIANSEKKVTNIFGYRVKMYFLLPVRVHGTLFFLNIIPLTHLRKVYNRIESKMNDLKLNLKRFRQKMLIKSV